MFKRKIVISLAALTILLSGVYAVTAAYANPGEGGPDFLSGLPQFIAEKFGLNQSEVESAVTEYENQHRQKMQAEMQEREEERLNALVESGEITAEQKQKILEERAVLHEKYDMENFKDLTEEQRKEQFENRQKDIEAWSESTGIDSKYLMMGPGRGGHGGPGKEIGGWNKTSPTPAS